MISITLRYKVIISIVQYMFLKTSLSSASLSLAKINLNYVSLSLLYRRKKKAISAEMNDPEVITKLF